MGSLYIIAAILIWSSQAVFIRVIHLDIGFIIFFSAFVSVVVTGVLSVLYGWRKTVPGGKGILYLLLLGPVSLLNVLSFFYAYRHTTVSNAVLTHYIAPVIVAFLAPVFLKEKLTGKVVFAIALSSVGLWIMTDGTRGALFNYLKSPTGNAAGIFAGLFSGLMYAVITILFRAFSQNSRPLAMCFFQNLAICAILLPFTLPFPACIMLNMKWLLPMGLLNSVIAPLLYYRGISSVQANRAAVLGYFEPVGAIALGVAFLGEFPAAKSVLGGILILAAGYLTLRAE